MRESCSYCEATVEFSGSSCPSCGVSKAIAEKVVKMRQQDKEQYTDIIFDGLYDSLSDTKICADLIAAGCKEADATMLLQAERTRNTKEAENRARKRVSNGWIVVLGGGAITVGTYFAAAGGGVYIVLWGAIIYGVVQIVRGVLELGDILD